jgi:hypothetical protein
MGLGYASMKERATRMGIEHISEIIKKHTDIGYIAYARTTRVANTYHYWPKEAYEATQARKIHPTRIIVHKVHARGGIRTHTYHINPKPNSDYHPCGLGRSR